MKNKMITFNMMSNAGSEEKTFNRVVCVLTETYFPVTTCLDRRSKED